MSGLPRAVIGARFRLSRSMTPAHGKSGCLSDATSPQVLEDCVKHPDSWPQYVITGIESNRM